MAKKNKSIEYEHIFTRFTKEQLALLSRDELIAVCLGAQDINLQLIKDFDAAKNKQIEIKESYLRLVEKLFKPSIKVIKPVKLPPKKKPSSRRPKGTLRERYPNLEVKETPVEMSPLCKCANCNVFMTDSGMTEDAEVLRVVPRKYYIELVKRHKYRCILCHGTILTAPAPAKIMPGSIYHDEVILYWALSKYADYMPIGRQASIAHLEGFNFPANSMLETTHYLSAFVEVAYDLCKVEVCSEKNLKADESPLRMLEGSERMSWYLWAFMGSYTVYYEAHDTRAGAICSSVILDAECESLLTDVFSGYKKSLREVNVARKKVGRPLVLSHNCNAHAVRKFKEPHKKDRPKEFAFYYELYQQIYKLEEEARKEEDPVKLLEMRKKMLPLYEKMQTKGNKDLRRTSNRGSLAEAINYFLNNYEALTRFIYNPGVDIDNNRIERGFKGHALGRKNWYGNHSVRGVSTYVILYTLIVSCRLNCIDPKRYFAALVKSLHGYGGDDWRKKENFSLDNPEWKIAHDKRKAFAFTPKQYRERLYDEEVKKKENSA